MTKTLILGASGQAFICMAMSVSTSRGPMVTGPPSCRRSRREVEPAAGIFEAADADAAGVRASFAAKCGCLGASPRRSAVSALPFVSKMGRAG